MPYRLTNLNYPYVPRLAGYGPGCAVPWPKFSMLSVGYTRHPDYPGNMIGEADGGQWEIVTTWQTGWMAIRSLLTGQIIFSVPSGTLEPIDS